MAELEAFNVVEETGKRGDTSKAVEQYQGGRRKVVQERTGKPRLKQETAYNPHYYSQHMKYYRDQGFYPSQGGGRHKDHRYASHDNWRWETDRQWTNGTDTYGYGEYPSYHYRGSKNSRKTRSTADSRPDKSRDGKKRVSEQCLSEDKISSLASGKEDEQKETIIRLVEKQPVHNTETISTVEKVATTRGTDSHEIENAERFAEDTVAKSPGKYRAKKSGNKSVPNARKYERTAASTVTHPHSTTATHNHKRKQPESKIKVSSSTYKERTENDEIKNEKSKDRDKGIGGKDTPMNVPGKYHVKKSTFKSASSATNVADKIDMETSSGSITNRSHGQKRRDYKAKNFRPVKQYGGVASSMQSDVLSQQLFSGQYECMVCCDRVRVKDPVWSCSTCYHIFHLKCIKKWAKIPTDLESGMVYNHFICESSPFI